MPSFIEYSVNDKIYIDLKQLLPLRPYAVGCKAITNLIQKKQYKDLINGQLIDGELQQREKRSYRHGSVYVAKTEIMELFDEDTPEIVEYPQAPPVIEDEDLIFFKDEDGNEYDVLMRGTRDRKGIFFKVKDVERVFEMQQLRVIFFQEHTFYQEGRDYQWFILPKVDNVNIGKNREMYLTYSGLKHLIAASRSGIGYKFREWIDEIVFAAAFGTVDQKAEALARTLNTDAEHLKAIMNKCSGDISCLYLIDIKQTVDGKRIFKYGYTKHLTKRFRQHMKRYGDQCELVKFVFIPEMNLSHAEKQLKDITLPHALQRDGEKELITLDEKELASTILVYQTISANYSGQLSQIVGKYEGDIKDIQSAHALELLRNQRDHERQIYEATLRFHEMEMQLLAATKDNEILRMKIELLERA